MSPTEHLHYHDKTDDCHVLFATRHQDDLVLDRTLFPLSRMHGLLMDHLLSICQICQRTAVQIFSSHHRHHQTSNCRYLIFSLLVPKMCHSRGEVELKMDHTLLCQDQMDLIL